MPPTLSRLVTALLLVSLPVATGLGLAQGAGPASQSGLDVGAIDRSIDPCSNFYQYACGEWVKKNPIPADRPAWGRFNELQDKNNEILRRVLDAAVANPAPATQKIGDYYAGCMDEAAIERKGATPLNAMFGKIDALRDVSGLPPLVADLQASGATVFFFAGIEPDPEDSRVYLTGVTQGGMGLPDRDYYFRTDPRSTDLRTQYTAHVAAMLTLAGRPQAMAATDAAAIMKLETALASAAHDAVTRRDPVKNTHRLPLADLQAMTPSFNWTEFLKAGGAPAIKLIDVGEPEFMKNLEKVLTSTPIAEIRTYLKWQFTRSAASVLSSAFVNENFRFYGRTLQGSQELRPRWRRCVQFTDRDLGEALGQAFVREAFGPEAKKGTLSMVKDIEAAFEDNIKELAWMTEPTRKQALAKLKGISNKIGYPDKWRDYRTLTIARDDVLGNKVRAAVFDSRRDLARVGKSVDKGEWFMTPPTVNAYYDPSQNNINFPAGILQPPFFSARADAAVNYGGAGAVIGHELSHGFDDSGRQFDAKGNLRDWWTPADGKAFEERASCLVKQYGAYTAVDDVKLNGELTLGENVADNGGVRMALIAYLASDEGRAAKTLDGFTPEQRFFLGFGQVWCESRRPEYERQLAQTDSHSSPRYRVNGVVSNMPEFQKAFSCKADAPMVSGQLCKVW